MLQLVIGVTRLTSKTRRFGHKREKKLHVCKIAYGVTHCSAICLVTLVGFEPSKYYLLSKLHELGPECL